MLLDTNALLWILEPSLGSLGKKATSLIKKTDTVYVSAASIFEIQIKVMLGKLKVPSNLLEVIERSNIKFLDITAAHADAIKKFPKLKKHDPFDRLLLAQSRTEGLPLLTADKFLLRLNGCSTIDAKI